MGIPHSVVTAAAEALADPNNDTDTSVVQRVAYDIPDWLWAVIGALLACLAFALLRVAREHRRRRVAASSALLDPLTGVGNFKAFNEQMTRDWSFARRHGTTFGVVVLDIDDFKQINDKHGHAAGDAVLVSTAEHLTNTTRPSDFVARIGGDEFAVICPHTDFEGLQTLRSKLDSHSLSTPEVEVGLSIGIAALREGDVASADIVERADVSMYDRKRERRSSRSPAPQRSAV